MALAKAGSRNETYVIASLFDNDKLLLREKMDTAMHPLTLQHPRRVPNQLECVDHVDTIREGESRLFHKLVDTKVR